MDILKYLPALPNVVVVPIILVTLVVSLWPRIYQLINDLSASQRAFRTEQQRLELLKLRYEIEALVKTHDIERIEDDVPSAATLPVPAGSLRDSPTPGLQLGNLARFGYGGIGGVIPSLLASASRVIMGLEGGDELDMLLPGGDFWIGAAIFFFLAGIIAITYEQLRRSRMLCVMAGLSVVLVIVALGNVYA